MISVDALRERIARLAEAEVDIRQRVESRSGRAHSSGLDAADPIRDRLFWVLARLGARRQAAEGQLGLGSKGATPPTHHAKAETGAWNARASARSQAADRGGHRGVETTAPPREAAMHR